MRSLTVLGIQGGVEYAQDSNGHIWYRFLSDPANHRDSWKLVAR